MQTKKPSLAVKVFVAELRRHRKLTIAVLAVCAADSVLMLGVLPYLIARYSAKISESTLDRALLGTIAEFVAAITCLHSLLFYLKLRWRRRLMRLGRAALSDAVEQAYRRSSVDTYRRSDKLNSASQKLQECWVDLIFSATEVFLPFFFGTICLFSVACIQVPSMALPLVLVLCGGATVAWVAGRHFSAMSRQINVAEASERDMIEAMLAVLPMKWLIDKIAPVRAGATAKFTDLFSEQSKINSRWQGLLLTLGGVLQVGSVAGGPELVHYGYSAGSVILMVLLGLTVGERFLSMTSIVCLCEWILFRALPMAAFLDAVQRQPTDNNLPAEVTMRYVLKGAWAEYTSKTGEQSVVQLPDLEIDPGINIVLGESGVGKSTLVGVLAREIEHGGHVTVGGYSLAEWNVSGRIVNGSQGFQSSEVPQWLLFESAKDQIDPEGFRLALKCAAYQDMQLDKLLSEVSGGQRRRAMLAAVIYHVVTSDFGDGVLIIDEPTNDLDPERIKQLVRGLRELAELYPQLTIIIPTHEKRLVRISDRIIVLYGGPRALVKQRVGGQMITVSDSR